MFKTRTVIESTTVKTNSKTNINNGIAYITIRRYLDKMRKEMPNKTSPSNEGIEHSAPAVSISKINNLFKPSSSTSTNKSSTSSQFNSNSIGKNSTSKEVKYLPFLICSQFSQFDEMS